MLLASNTIVLQPLFPGGHEDKPNIGMIIVVWMAVVRTELATIRIVFHVEQQPAPVRISNRLHADNQPFPQGLVGVLQTELRGDLGRAQSQASLAGGGVDISQFSSLQEAD